MVLTGTRVGGDSFTELVRANTDKVQREEEKVGIEVRDGCSLLNVGPTEFNEGQV